MPDDCKDFSYWERRRRNNEAARRSRQKNRMNGLLVEKRVRELSRENAMLRARLAHVIERFGLQDEFRCRDDDYYGERSAENWGLLQICQASFSPAAADDSSACHGPDGGMGDETFATEEELDRHHRDGDNAVLAQDYGQALNLSSSSSSSDGGGGGGGSESFDDGENAAIVSPHHGDVRRHLHLPHKLRFKQ